MQLNLFEFNSKLFPLEKNGVTWCKLKILFGLKTFLTGFVINFGLWFIVPVFVVEFCSFTLISEFAVDFRICVELSEFLKFLHCLKSVQIRSIFWSVFSRIWTEYGEIRSGKIRTRKYSVFVHFSHSVSLSKTFRISQGVLNFYTAWKVFKYGVFSGLYFPAFGLNTERYEVGKYGPENTPYLDTFHTVLICRRLSEFLKEFWIYSGTFKRSWYVRDFC